MKYIYCIIISIISLHYSIAQSCSSPIPKECSELIRLIKPSVTLKEYNPTGVQILNTEKRIEYCSNCLDQTSNNKELAQLHYIIANNQYYLNNQNSEIVKHLKVSYNYDSDYFCKVYKSYGENGRMEEFDLHFVDKLADKEIKNLVSICNSKNKIGSQSVNKKLFSLSKEYAEIQKRDQKYRDVSGINEKLQLSLDQVNRETMDSIYYSYKGDPKNFINDDNFMVFWPVLQHSTDCSWNYRWFPIFLEAFKTNNIDRDKYMKLMIGTKNRFFDIDGCYSFDKTNARLIETKYPFVFEK